MGMLAMLGFEGRNFERDGIIHVSGATPTYATDVPPDSASSRSLQGTANSQTLRYPWLNAGSLQQPSGNSWWIGYRVKAANATTLRANEIVLGGGYSGARGIGVALEDYTGKYVIEINDVAKATSSSASMSLSTWTRVMIKVSNWVASTSCTIEVYIDGDLSSPVVTYSATTDTPANKPNEFYFGCRGAGDFYDDVWAMDPNDATGTVDPQKLIQASIAGQVPTSDGNYTAWTGTYADIDELPASDADGIEVSAIDTRQSWNHAAIGHDRVLAVQMKARVVRTDTSAGSNIQMFMREGATDDDQTSQAAPGSGDVVEIMDEKRGGGAWTATDYDNTEFGVVSRT